jgi:hypothetical protein
MRTVITLTRARHQFSRAGAFEAVAGHVGHVAMEALPTAMPAIRVRPTDKSTPATPIWENPSSWAQA